MILRCLPVLLLSLPAAAVDVKLDPGADIRGLTGSIGPGDVYTFGDGVYEVTNNWEITAPGTESSPVVFKAAEGAKPVIRLKEGGNRVLRIYDSTFLTVSGLSFEMDDERFDNGGNGVRIENSSDVTLENGVVKHIGNSAVVLGGDTQRVAVRRMELTDIRDGFGIYAGCSDASCWTQGSVFDNNLIHDTGSRDENLRNDGIYLSPGCQDNRIVDNVLFDINRHGIVTTSTEFGERNVVEGNVVWGAGSHGLYIAGSALVRNNLAFSTGGHGLYSENNRDSLENVAISFNTFVDTDRSSVRLNDWAGRTGMVFANNLIANPVGEAFEAAEDDLDDGVLISTNVITGRVQWLDFEAGHFLYGGGYTEFEDWKNWNFYPTNFSVSRAAADPQSGAFVPELDFNGQQRNGETPTVGAYEYVFGTNPGWLIREDFKEDEDRINDSENTQGGCCGKNDAGPEAAFVVLPLFGLGLLARRRRRELTR